MRIAHIEFGHRPIFLAPMEDVSDPPFRRLCKRYGADLLYTEFISSGGLVYQAEDSLKKLEFHEDERPVAIQIFGGEIEQVREAAAIVDRAEPDIIDINFGCPVRKVVCQDGGAGILRNLPKMEAIAAAVVEATSRPVTVKTRLGWDDATIRIHEVVRMLESVGVRAVAVHARTRSQLYSGSARWSWLRELKDSSSGRIPIIGNGDATTPDKIRAMFEETGVDAVMIGRGAIGNPWIFRDAKALLESGEVPAPPSWEERVAVVGEHLTMKSDWLGERRGVLEMRRMYSGYFRGFPGCVGFKQRIMEETTCGGVLEILLNSSPADFTRSRIAVPETEAVGPETQ